MQSGTEEREQDSIHRLSPCGSPHGNTVFPMSWKRQEVLRRSPVGIEIVLTGSNDSPSLSDLRG